MELPALLKASLILVAAAAVQTASAVEFQAINNATGTPDGARFDTVIGLQYTTWVLSNASSFIWATFKQSESGRKRIRLVKLIVEEMDGVAYTVGVDDDSCEIHLSAGYVAGYKGDVRTEVEGVLYHEDTHVWQWDGNDTTPSGLIEGVADFVRLRAGLGPSHWVKPGEGDKWDQGYDVTARFLDYCDGLKTGGGDGSFVADLNHGMKDGYDEGIFVQLLGKTVDELWKEYKAYYGK